MNVEATTGVAIIHTFSGELPEQLEIRLPITSGFQIVDVYSDDLTAFGIRPYESQLTRNREQGTESKRISSEKYNVLSGFMEKQD